MMYLITDPTALSLSMPLMVLFVWWLGNGLWIAGPLGPYKN